MADHESKASALVRVGIYIRVSTEEQKRREFPVDTQLGVCRDVCVRHFGPGAYVVVDEFIDDGYSGTLGLRAEPGQMGGFRPELTRLVEAIDAGEVNVVVCQDQDRLSRDEPVWFELSMKHFLTHGVRLYDANGEVDFTSPNGSLFTGVKAVFSAHMPRQNAAKVKAGLAQRAREGYPTTRSAYGWEWQPRPSLPGQRRGIQPVPEQRTWVLYIRDRYLSGWGCQRIAKDLNAHKIPAPEGPRWSAGTLHNILTCALHAGHIRTPEGELVRGAHWDQRFYDLDVLERILDQKKRRSRRRGKADRSEFVLSGLLKCPGGRNMIGGRYPEGRLYHCTHLPDDPTSECRGISRRADFIETAVLDRVAEIAGSPEMKALADEAVEQTLEEDDCNLRERKRAADAALRDGERRRRRWEDLYLEGKLSRQRFEERDAEIALAIEQAKAETSAISRALQDGCRRRQDIQEVREVLTDFTTVWRNLDRDERRQLLALLLESLILEPADGGARLWIKPRFLPEHTVFIPGGREPRRRKFGVEALTLRELAVVVLLDDGLSAGQIASRWGVRSQSIEAHKANIRRKLEVHTTQDAIDIARDRAQELRRFLPLTGRKGEGRPTVSFSPRQSELLQLLADESLGRPELAERMGVTPKSLNVYITSIAKRLGVRGRKRAVARARELRLLP